MQLHPTVRQQQLFHLFGLHRRNLARHIANDRHRTGARASMQRKRTVCSAHDIAARRLGAPQAKAQKQKDVQRTGVKRPPPTHLHLLALVDLGHKRCGMKHLHRPLLPQKGVGSEGVCTMDRFVDSEGERERER